MLVTGGAGFIGSHTAAHLLRRGNKVVVVDEVNDYYDVSQKMGNVAHLEALAAEVSDPTRLVFVRAECYCTRSGMEVTLVQLSRECIPPLSAPRTLVLGDQGFGVRQGELFEQFSLGVR